MYSVGTMIITMMTKTLMMITVIDSETPKAIFMDTVSSISSCVKKMETVSIIKLLRKENHAN